MQRAYSKSCQVIGSEGSIHWDFDRGEVKLYCCDDQKWHSYSPGEDFDFNQTYTQELKHFLGCIESGQPTMHNEKVGRQVLRVVDAVKQSSKSGNKVTVVSGD